ncbi:hypothetical protein E2C01_007456 [Portunus trituberculatus]|uniref:Uncharacterized protein n=1 Tax=Portunus trituberculatus TaxID=210409 RepID=A0A5B7D072_PORTR|nr:hypothetical protein [Portunus trituberculatus]
MVRIRQNKRKTPQKFIRKSQINAPSPHNPISSLSLVLIPFIPIPLSKTVPFMPSKFASHHSITSSFVQNVTRSSQYSSSNLASNGSTLHLLITPRSAALVCWKVTAAALPLRLNAPVLSPSVAVSYHRVCGSCGVIITAGKSKSEGKGEEFTETLENKKRKHTVEKDKKTLLKCSW